MSNEDEQWCERGEQGLGGEGDKANNKGKRQSINSNKYVNSVQFTFSKKVL